MNDWDSIYRKVRYFTYLPGAGTRLFRGLSEADWPLMPAMGRVKWVSENDQRTTESNAYGAFVTSAGDLLPTSADSWTVAFTMRHHGLATRLLDWTEAFAVAVFFALRNSTGDAAVWMLDPYELNKESLGHDTWVQTHQIDETYHEMFIGRTKQARGDVIAILPPRSHKRMLSQKAGFTLHADLTKPLEDLHPKVLQKFVLPKAIHQDARAFLDLAGISEYSLFPDLDGLARHVGQLFVRKPPPA